MPPSGTPDRRRRGDGAAPAGAGASYCLVADVGGTNARFARADGSGVGPATTLPTADFDGPAAAIRAWLGREGGGMPRAAAIAGAGPVAGRLLRLTNARWRIDAASLEAELGIGAVLLVNDFEAAAWAIPDLGERDLRAVGAGAPAAGAPAAILGAGTGLGVAGYVPGPPSAVIAGEGGHVTMPAQTADEAAMLDALRGGLGHVSAEHLLSGDGLVRLYDWFNGREPRPGPARSPSEVTAAALDGSCAASRRALERFCAMLGTVAGDVALTLGARGGVYVAGGIAPRVADALAASAFRVRFEAKGRFGGWLSRIPTWIVLHPAPALVGLARLLRDRGLL